MDKTALKIGSVVRHHVYGAGTVVSEPTVVNYGKLRKRNPKPQIHDVVAVLFADVADRTPDTPPHRARNVRVKDLTE